MEPLLFTFALNLMRCACCHHHCAVREAGLLPSVALLFRWTGESARAMAHVPALRRDLLQQARPAAVTY